MEHRININECAAALRKAAPEIDIAINEPMSRHTTFAIGGPADLFVMPKTIAELTTALSVVREHELPLLVLGNGSNMLVSDDGVRGTVICTIGLDEVRVGEDCRVTAEAGALLSRVARRAQRAGLTGAEFSAGIPGSLGGAVFMNAGAYDGQMAGIVGKNRVSGRSGRAACAGGGGARLRLPAQRFPRPSRMDGVAFNAPAAAG